MVCPNEVGGGLETPPAMPTRSGVPHPKQRRGKPGGDLTDSFENREEGGRDLRKPSRFFFLGPKLAELANGTTNLRSLLVFNYHQLPILAGKIETYPSPSEAHELPPLLQIQKIGTSAAFTW